MEAKVGVVTVTYGKRWHFLSQVVEAVMADKHVGMLVIVDNGSENEEEIKNGVQHYGNKVIILRQEKNLGSAGGFVLGLERIREVDCDNVFILDDDTVPEENAIGKFLELRKRFESENIVLVGNRVNIPGNEDIFYTTDKTETTPKETFFEGISFKKIKHFAALFDGKKKERSRALPVEYVPNESFVYGGAFIPIDAIRRAPLPDKNLVLYGDDIEYSWGIKRLGYESYVCYSPKIYDIEMSFGEGSQAVGLFDPATAPFKVYYRLRNMVLISRRNTQQSKLILFFNILLWVKALFILGLFRYGVSWNYCKKVALVYKAVHAGYFPHSPIPEEAKLP